MYNLSTLMKRLEAVTSRLEDIATYAENSGNTALASKSIRDVLKFEEPQLASPVPDVAVSAKSNQEPEVRPRHIEEFDEFIENSIGRYVKLSDEIGGSVAEQAAYVHAAFQEQRRILTLASTTKKPDASGWKGVLQPTNDAASKVVSTQENSNHDNLHDHLCCVADGIPVLGWISIEMFPFRHVDKFLGYTEYFGNKVTVRYKKSDPKHAEWVQSYYQVFRDLSELVKRNYQSGITWRVGDK